MKGGPNRPPKAKHLLLLTCVTVSPGDFRACNARFDVTRALVAVVAAEASLRKLRELQQLASPRIRLQPQNVANPHQTPGSQLGWRPLLLLGACASRLEAIPPGNLHRTTMGKLLGAPGLSARSKKLLGVPGLTTRSKKILGAPGLTTRSKKLVGVTARSKKLP